MPSLDGWLASRGLVVRPRGIVDLYQVELAGQIEQNQRVGYR
jgi:hypothetical protein